MLAFLLATGALLLQGVLWSGFSLCVYAPWIAFVCLRSSWMRALWLSLMAGLFVDLLSDHPFGIHAIAYAMTAFALFRFKNYFSVGQPLHLGIFSALVSCTATLATAFLLFLFDRRVPFAGIWMFGDLIAMPIVDGVYAVVWFSGPLALVAKIVRQWNLFWLKRKNLSPISR